MRGDLPVEVAAGRSQNPKSTDVPNRATKGLPGGDARHSRAGGSTLPRVVLGGNERRGKQSRAEGSWVGRTRRSRWLAPSYNVTAARLACTREAGKIRAGVRCRGGEGLRAALVTGLLVGKADAIAFGALAASACPDVETSDWRAVCGRTARTVRREGRRKPSLPLCAPVMALRASPQLN